MLKPHIVKIGGRWCHFISLEFYRRRQALYKDAGASHLIWRESAFNSAQRSEVFDNLKFLYLFCTS